MEAHQPAPTQRDLAHAPAPHRARRQCAIDAISDGIAAIRCRAQSGALANGGSSPPPYHLTAMPPPPLVPPAYLALAINFSSLVRDRMSDAAERSVSIDTARPTCSHSWHRLEVRRAVLPSGIRLIVWITVGARRDPTTTPLIERGPPGFSSAGSAARHLPAYEHVYQRRQHLHLSAACAQDLPATTAEAGQTATPSSSPPVITSASPPTFQVSFFITIFVNVLDSDDQDRDQRRSGCGSPEQARAGARSGGTCACIYGSSNSS